MEDERLMERKVTKWTRMLDSGEKVEHALRRLEGVRINLRLLSATGVGKAVNSIRKHPDWGERATRLVARWKEAARAETEAVAAQREEQRRSSSEGEETEQEEENSGLEEAEEEEEGDEDEEEDEPERLQANGHKQNGKFSAIQQSNEEENGDDEDSLDAFSAQLAAADKIAPVPKVKVSPRKRKMPQIQISHESIRNSLIASLSSPMPEGQHKHNGVKPRKESASTLENIFKAPKEMRRVYAGKKQNKGQYPREVPKLYDLCIRLLMSNIDAIDETGDIPFDILRPVLEKANWAQLKRLEEKNPYLQEDTDLLWRKHCEKEFPNELAQLKQSGSGDEDEEEAEDRLDYLGDGLGWKQRYFKFLRNRDRRLKMLTKQIKTHVNETVEPQRQALVTAPIAPRNVRKRQIQSGMVVSAHLVPTAVDLTRARRQIFENGNNADIRSMPSAIRNTSSMLGARSERSSSGLVAKKKPQQGPLMLKTLKMLKQQRRQ